MANEDKMFELMEKMYIVMNRRFDTVNEKLDKKADKEDIVRLEYDISSKFNALFDGYKQSIDGINEIKKTVKDMSDKLVNQEVEIRVLKAVK